jgi:glycosyltransferase EpsH
MNNNTPLISVIIPVYNVAQYLRRCLDSVVNQTYRNLEIILVNDGSTDDSGSICDEYAVRDSRVIVMHKENRGVAHARNAGIEESHGAYIMFVDSDDWVDTDICSVLINGILESGAQSAMCSYVREYPDRSLPKEIVPVDTVFSGSEIQRRLCGPVGEELRYPENLECFNTLCGRLYPTHALREKQLVDLKEIGSSEDLLYNLEVFSSIESMVYINRPLYHYRKSVSHSITASYRPELDRQWDILYAKIAGIIEENRLGEKFRYGLKNRIALNTLGVCLNCVQDSAGFPEKCGRIRKILANPLRKDALKQLTLKYMPLHWKLFYFSAKHNLTILLCALSAVIMKLKGKV